MFPVLFQFLNGTIIRQYQQHYKADAEKFQFLNGTIISRFNFGKKLLFFNDLFIQKYSFFIQKVVNWQ